MVQTVSKTAYSESEDAHSSNCNYLLLLRANCNLGTLQWLEKKDIRNVSPDIKNEFWEIVAMKIPREIGENIKGSRV